MKTKTLTLLFVFLILLIITLADRNEIGFLHFLYDFPGGDKVGHLLLFGILSFLLNLTALRSLHPRTCWRVAATTSLILALALAIEEWSQRFFPARTFDLLDLFFSEMGVAGGAWLACKKIPPSLPVNG